MYGIIKKLSSPQSEKDMKEVNPKNVDPKSGKINDRNGKLKKVTKQCDMKKRGLYI